MKEKLIVRGCLVTPADIVFIRSFIEKYHDKGRTFISKELVEKLRCILPLPNLLSSLARRFACCQSCSVSLRTLWAYGFDSAAPRALEKSKLGEKEKYFISFNQIYFLKRYIEVTERLSRGWQISLIMPSNGLGLLFFKNTPVCPRQACG